MSALSQLQSNYSFVTTAVDSLAEYDHPVYYDTPSDHWAMTAFIDLFWYIIATIISCICCVSFVLLFYIQQTRRYQSKHSHRSTDRSPHKQKDGKYMMTKNPCHPRFTPRAGAADGTPSHQMPGTETLVSANIDSPFSPKLLHLPFSPNAARSATDAALPTLTVTTPPADDTSVQSPSASAPTHIQTQTVSRNTVKPKTKHKNKAKPKGITSNKPNTAKNTKAKVIYKRPKRARNVTIKRNTADCNAHSHLNARQMPHASHRSTSSTASSSGTAISTTCSSTLSSHTTIDMDVHPRDAASTVQSTRFQPHVQTTSVASAASAASYSATSATMTFSHQKNPQSLSAFSGIDSDGIDVAADPNNAVFHELHPIPESIHEVSHSWTPDANTRAPPQRANMNNSRDAHMHGQYAAVNASWQHWPDSRPPAESEEEEEEEEEDGSSEGCDESESESASEEDRPRARHTHSRKLKTLQQQMEFAEEFVYEQQQALSQYVQGSARESMFSPYDSKPRSPDTVSSEDTEQAPSFPEHHQVALAAAQQQEEEAANEETRMQRKHICQETPLSVFTAISSVSAAMARFETNAVFPNGMTSLNAEPSVESEDEEEDDDDDDEQEDGESETSVDSDQNTIIAMMKKRSNLSTGITVNSALSGTTNYFEKPSYKFSHATTETTVHTMHSDPRAKRQVV
eukprot:CAMPEP_0197027412 /NCGR_PEP_ID=MMETSP1384-20130603/7319_1 /TAXON_ID=29189 /ORGANISM="Ammonia sp." /LENGTH=684 /DNA_ID=CAMNT_0042456247 /DNA_START=41 /DNA_END=2095 /DNA_ORIENTATION=+